MATYEERAIIIRDAQLNPDSYADETAFQAAYPDSTKADAISARTLSRRVQAAVLDVATEQLALDVTDKDNRGKIEWAKKTTASPESEALRALRILLALFDGDPNTDLTPAQLFAVTDSAIKTQLDALVPYLSLGAERPR